MGLRKGISTAFVMVPVAALAVWACYDDAPAGTVRPVGPAPTTEPSAPIAEASSIADGGATDTDATVDARPDAEPEEVETDLDAGPPGPTFRNVYAIFHKSCSGGCHVRSSFPSGGLGMPTRARAYQNLVGRACSTDFVCRGKTRVVPNDPDASVLYTKIARAPSCGEPMPPEEGKELPSDDVALVRAWIMAGAPND